MTNGLTLCVIKMANGLTVTKQKKGRLKHKNKKAKNQNIYANGMVEKLNVLMFSKKYIILFNRFDGYFNKVVFFWLSKIKILIHNKCLARIIIKNI